MCPWFDSWRYHLKRQNPLRKEWVFCFQDASKARFRKRTGRKNRSRYWREQGFGIFRSGLTGTTSPANARGAVISWNFQVGHWQWQLAVQGSRFKVQGSRFKVQGSRFKVQGSIRWKLSVKITHSNHTLSEWKTELQHLQLRN